MYANCPGFFVLGFGLGLGLVLGPGLKLIIQVVYEIDVEQLSND